jgi:predicted enzyme related to lactoylglutathione lyase
MPPRPIVHFEIHGKDGKKLQEFYRTLFEWNIEHNPAMNYGMVEAGIGGPENGVGGGIAQSPMAPVVTVYVQVADLSETLKKAESMGGTTVMPPMDVPNGPTIAQMRDPEGNLIGLVQQ